MIKKIVPSAIFEGEGGSGDRSVGQCFSTFFETWHIFSLKILQGIPPAESIKKQTL